MGWLPKVGSLCAAEKQQQPKLKQREEEGEGKGSTTPQMASRVAGQNRVAEEGASDGERSKALEGEVDLKFCCAPALTVAQQNPFLLPYMSPPWKRLHLDQMSLWNSYSIHF